MNATMSVRDTELPRSTGQPAPAANEPSTAGHLLIVDDEVGPRESLRIVFKDQYHVATASCGREGVEYARQHPVDVAILDIRMPDMSGTDVLREIKLIDPHIEVIMLTGYETIESARAAVRYGAADYLNKPFDVFKMRETVARCFEKRRLTREAEDSLRELQQINRELEEEVLAHERKLAAGELSSGIVHEMNNPLAVISARTEMLQRELSKADTLQGAAVEKVRQQIECIHAEAMRCRKISQRFLSFLRAGGETCQAIGIREILEDSLALVKAHPSCQATVIEFQPPADDLRVVAHTADLTQIFLNLGINAVQAMEGQGKLTVSVETQPAARDWLAAAVPDGCSENHFRSASLDPQRPVVIVTVKDTGPGIPPPVIKRIFQPYFTTKEKGVGTGLGLAICVRFLDRLHGGIRFLSRPGEGTTVTVLLPRAAA